ncbi:MAG TPA: GNAT family N-acetyltransferase [Actinomycetales bacterium]|nr:GNAT family N-acetyltransferase [Actinomycetales bacterium]
MEAPRSLADPVVTLRLATPADVPAIEVLYSGLSPASQRMRFSTCVSDALLARAAALGDRFDAVVALDGERVIGEARLDTHPGGAHEFAVTVADQAQGRGVGAALLDALREHANDLGIVTLRAQVRIDNVPMLVLLRRVGAVIVLVSGGDVVLDIASDRQMPSWPAHAATAKVLVETPGLAEHAITTALRSAGYDVRQCGGPTSGRREPCPLLDSGRCRLAQDADAIICLLPEGGESSAIVASHALHRPESLAAGFALSRR